MYVLFIFFFFFVKQKTAYEMRIIDWSSGVCSSDLFFAAWRFLMLMSNFLPRNPSPCFHSARHSHRLGFRLLITLQSPRPGGLLDEERETLLDIIPPFRQPDDPFQIGRASCRERECQYV